MSGKRSSLRPLSARKRALAVLAALVLLIVIAIATLTLDGDDDIEVSAIALTSESNSTVLSFNVENNHQEDFKGQYSYLIREAKANDIMARGGGNLSIPAGRDQTVESVPDVVLPRIWPAYTEPGAKPVVEIFIKDDEGNQVYTLRRQITV